MFFTVNTTNHGLLPVRVLDAMCERHVKADELWKGITFLINHRYFIRIKKYKYHVENNNVTNTIQKY